MRLGMDSRQHDGQSSGIQAAEHHGMIAASCKGDGEVE